MSKPKGMPEDEYRAMKVEITRQWRLRKQAEYRAQLDKAAIKKTGSPALPPGEKRRKPPVHGPKRPASNTQSHGEARFIAVLPPGTRVVGDYKNTRTKVHLICPAGHDWHPYPVNVVSKGTGCRTCAGQADGEQRYRDFLADTGWATPAWDVWPGVDHPCRVICPEGHFCSPTPNTVMVSSRKKRRGVCEECGRRASEATRRARSEAKWLAYLESVGAKPNYDYWPGLDGASATICPNGHECHPWPDAVMKGRQGLCSECAVRGFKYAQPAVVYLITSPALNAHKVGIAAGDGERRLTLWRGRGWDVYKVRSLDTGRDAYTAEQSVLAWLREDLDLLEYLSPAETPDGWSETVCADSIDLPTIWARVVAEAARLAC